MCATASGRSHWLSYMMLFESFRRGELYRTASTKVTISPSDSSIYSGYATLYNHNSNSSQNLTIQATVHWARPSDHRLRDHRRLNKPYFTSFLPTSHKQFTVYGLCSLEFVCGNPTPCHISPSRAMKDWPPDSSSQHTALSRSAFSPAAVSWTTSGDKRLPECLACRRFTRTQGWFILALHKQASVYISLVLRF